MNTADKFVIRKSILELAKQGIPRSSSIDYEIKRTHGEIGYEGNLWDCVTALGAQLSRPPYDPYREIINLDTYIGRGKVDKIVLNMPLLIYSTEEIPEGSREALHIALNRLAESGIALGFVSKTLSANRKYFLFQKVDGPSEYDSNGLVLEYKNAESIRILERIRNGFDGPIIVEVDEGFSDYASQLLNSGADGLLIDTGKVTRNGRYKKKHAMKVIRDARSAIDKYYNRKANDGACLIVAGDINNSGNIIKAASLGADVIGYSTSLLIANAEMHSDKPLDASTVAEMIYRHILGTKGEIKGVVGALGYSNFHNLSSSDLRTSNIEASLQGNIALEGTCKSYKQIVEETFDDLIREEGIEIEETEKQKVLRSMVEE